MSFTERSEMIFGKENIAKLSRASVAVFGLGGVGGSAVEALARAGVGEFHLIDSDRFSESNLNRQMLATRDAVGRLKVEVAKERILSINPDAIVRVYPIFFLPESEGSIPFAKLDYVVDAIDTVSAKILIAKRCHEAGIPIVSCMGCGNRIDPQKLCVMDLFDTKNDPLARVMRRELRKLGINSLPVVCSDETPIKPLFTISSDAPTRRDVPGSTPFVPPVAGYLLSREVVLGLMGFDPENRV